MATIGKFLFEMFSLMSRFLNVMRGGDAGTTLSEASHVEGLRLERVIDVIFIVLTLGREKHHCRDAWNDEVARMRRIVAQEGYQEGVTD